MAEAVQNSSLPSGNLPPGVDPELWNTATADQQKVMRRIAAQRERLHARAAARAQAVAVRKAQSQERVRPDDPLVKRVASFVRLHPIAVAVAGAAAMMIGPRKLVRLGGVVIPWIVRLQQRRRA